MGRHREASPSALGLGRAARLAGLVGGLAWVTAVLLPRGGDLENALLWAGALLLTAALCGLGSMLVRGDVPALRVFVAVAVPALVWGVFALVYDQLSETRVVAGLFGAVVAILCGIPLGARSGRVRRATL